MRTTYLPSKGIPPRVAITGSDKAASAFSIPLASEKALPDKTRNDLSISAAINPLVDWCPTPVASATEGLHHQN